MNAYRPFITIILMLALVSVAQAATLHTPPLQASSLACEVVNVSDQEIVVDVTVTKADGSVVQTTGPVSLPSLHIGGLTLSNVPSLHHSCRIQVEGGNKLTVRGSLCVLDDLSGQCTAAVEAR
jgi:hypothetical protein